MMRPHVVRQGDYLSRIAHRLGVAPEEIWDHPKNGALKDARMSGEILEPGDVVWVPEPVEEPLPVRRGDVNEYATTVPTNLVRLLLKDGDRPLKKEPYVIAGLGGEPIEGETSSEGLLTFDAPFDVSEVTVTLIRRRVRHVVRIGHLDPIESLSGQRQRLLHLGYYGWIVDPRPEDPIHAHSDDGDRAAISAFQSASGLAPTGAADLETLAALLDAHGS